MKSKIFRLEETACNNDAYFPPWSLWPLIIEKMNRIADKRNIHTYRNCKNREFLTHGDLTFRLLREFGSKFSSRRLSLSEHRRRDRRHRRAKAVKELIELSREDLADIASNDGSVAESKKDIDYFLRYKKRTESKLAF